MLRSLVLHNGAVRAKFSDILDIDQESHLLYIGDNWSDGVDVFDVSTPMPPTRPQSSWVAYDQTNGVVYAPAIEEGKPALISFALPQ